MPNKQYLLQLGESALLAGLIAIYPLLSSGKIDWTALIVVVAFAVAHSLATYVKNSALRDAISNDLSAAQKALPTAWLSSKQQAPTLNLPAIPKQPPT